MACEMDALSPGKTLASLSVVGAVGQVTWDEHLMWSWAVGIVIWPTLALITLPEWL